MGIKRCECDRFFDTKGRRVKCYICSGEEEHICPRCGIMYDGEHCYSCDAIEDEHMVALRKTKNPTEYLTANTFNKYCRYCGTEGKLIPGHVRHNFNCKCRDMSVGVSVSGRTFSDFLDTSLLKNRGMDFLKIGYYGLFASVPKFINMVIKTKKTRRCSQIIEYAYFHFITNGMEFNKPQTKYGILCLKYDFENLTEKQISVIEYLNDERINLMVCKTVIRTFQKRNKEKKDDKTRN